MSIDVQKFEDLCQLVETMADDLHAHMANPNPRPVASFREIARQARALKISARPDNFDRFGKRTTV